MSENAPASDAAAGYVDAVKWIGGLLELCSQASFCIRSGFWGGRKR
jgi:hypothetical protein